MREVGEEWDVEPAEAALLARRVHPRQVREVRVHRACHDLRTVGNSVNSSSSPNNIANLSSHLSAEGLELCDPVVEGEDLGGADEGEVERVEEEHEVLALKKERSSCVKFSWTIFPKI